MAMLTTSTSLALAAVAALNAPPAAVDISAWAAELYASPTVARPIAKATNQKRIFASPSLQTSGEWAAEQTEQLRIRTEMLESSASVTASALGALAHWNFAPSMLELQSFLSLPGDWDGEGAPSPDIASILSAMRFLQNADINAYNWAPTLHSDGRIILESELSDFEAELVFGNDGKIALWIDRGAGHESALLNPQEAIRVLS